MTNTKFKEEISTLTRFFEFYCKDKHINQNNIIKTLQYKNDTNIIELELCNDCYKLINYSIERLQNCPHEIKPRCRKCPNPCYEKYEWKNLAKIMKYSGTRLPLVKIKNFFLK